jgi:hypothetical protein
MGDIVAVIRSYPCVSKTPSFSGCAMRCVDSVGARQTCGVSNGQRGGGHGQKRQHVASFYLRRSVIPYFTVACTALNYT